MTSVEESGDIPGVQLGLQTRLAIPVELPSTCEQQSWRPRNRYYRQFFNNMHARLVSPRARVLDLACGTGDLLAEVQPSMGVGIESDATALEVARQRYASSTLAFHAALSAIEPGSKFDFIVLPLLLHRLIDIQRALEDIHVYCAPGARLIISTYNVSWALVLKGMARRIGIKLPARDRNWLGVADVENVLMLSDFQLETSGIELLVPWHVPLLSEIANRYLIRCPPFWWLGLLHYYVAEPMPRAARRVASVSVVVPCRNEVGNVDECVSRLPDLGSHTELVFVDGQSTDGTVEKIEEIIERYRSRKDIRLIHQVCQPAQADIATSGRKVKMLPAGKGDAVKKGFAAASGDVLMILDADLTVPPEDLLKFFNAIASGKADFVNGSRLVYPLEGQSMRVLNLIGNKLFSLLFTWILGQRIKDTLCGTKALWRKDYERIVAEGTKRESVDPFGDFDLLFGAAQLKLRIIDLPVRYRRRVSGHTKVRVVEHGLLLIKMACLGFIRLKLKALGS